MAAASLAVSPAMARATHRAQAAPDRSAAPLCRSSFSGRPLKLPAHPRPCRSVVRISAPRSAAVETVQVTEMALVDKSVNTIRFLAIDAVEKANSGHPGLPMGCAPMGHILYDEMMRYNPKNPYWFNRDRFVLSAGHGCMLQYALLHLAGYDSVRLGVFTAGDGDIIAKKLMAVAMWCIQWFPVNRPSMKMVIRMIYGSTERWCFGSLGVIGTNMAEMMITMQSKISVLADV